ncbi:putative Protocadherin 1 protein [Naja naja]|nr:putative Protocadherin 1 protein [Naja naja]
MARADRPVYNSQLLHVSSEFKMQQLVSCLGVWFFLQLPNLGSATRVVYKVQEEQPPNTLIGSLAADYGFPDVGHLYKLEVGAPYLRVDGKTGDIYTTETSIDRAEQRIKMRNSHN